MKNSKILLNLFSWAKFSKLNDASVADIEFIQNALSKLPPSIRQKVSQISINWLANWMKEKLITELRG